MPNKLKAVLFDLDGTLIDSIGLIVDAMHYAFEGFTGTVPADKDWMAGIGTPLYKQLALYARSPEELDALREKYRAFQFLHHDNVIKAYPGTGAVLENLHARGIVMGIVTSKGDVLAQRGIELTGLAQYLPVVIGADSVTKHKPEPEPVLLALERLGVQADEALMMGDSPHDISSGNAAHVQTIGALWGPFTREQIAVAKPTYWMNNISELPAFLDANF
ncbi:MAG TPA: HAD-IA family hydrolase [Gemmatimonadaceae bacterium]|nr:HAD-IA family hydrolase [Gemmatimonadaceae bacterium]